MRKKTIDYRVNDENFFLNVAILLRAIALKLDPHHQNLKLMSFQVHNDLKKMQEDYVLVKKMKK